VDGAEAQIREALRLDPDNPTYLNNLGVLLMMRERWPEAYTVLDRVLALDPDNGLAQDLLLEISLAVDGAVELAADEYVFLALTATPLPPTPYGNPPTASNSIATASPVTTPLAGTAAPEPRAENPVCGAAALSLLLPAAALVLFRRRQAP